MSRLIVIGLFVVLLGVLPLAAQDRDCLWPDLKVGEIGNFRHTKDSYYKTRVVEIIDKNTMIMRVGTRDPLWIMKGVPTKDLADGEIHELTGEYKVTGTKRYEGRTYKVVEPVAKK